MSNASSLIRTLIIYSICVPLAIFIGYLMANPMDYASIFSLVLLGGVLMIPLFLRWHHFWLIASFNLGAVLFFVPGRPYLWLSLAWVSLLISIVQYILNPRLKFLHAPAVTKPLLFLVLVVLVTAKLTGGIGLNSLGSETMGGKKYVFLLSGVVAYFALISQRITPKRAYLCFALFFLGSLSTMIGELPTLTGQSFSFIYWVFPVSNTGYRAYFDNGGAIGRLEGLCTAGAAGFNWMLCRYGISELFNLRRIGRLLLFVCFAVLSLMGGFRSALIGFGVTFAVLFYLEGMMRSRLLPMVLLVMVLGGSLVIGFSDQMPYSIQRTLSFLPVKVDPAVRESAAASTEWRVKMWRDVLPEVPKYLLLGKGYALNAKDMATMHIGSGFEGGMGLEGTEWAGDYHSGPLSLIIPFGIFGVLAFLWFLFASLGVLYKNYKFGHPAYRNLNRYLMAYFLVKIFLFFIVFGAFNSDLVTFTALVGLSISLNGGVAKPVLVSVPQMRLRSIEMRPAFARPVAVGAHSSSTLG
ncbi:MAG TPA: O-antigen ligase family protein [Candidatus Eisenbacteria bacterium]|nr:O-antigen ligase family protein [Candidatus Eisenbacteria bacterium]